MSYVSGTRADTDENPLFEWLEKNNLSDLYPSFSKHRITIDVVGKLTQEELKEMDIGITQRKIYSIAVEDIKNRISGKTYLRLRNKRA